MAEGEIKNGSSGRIRIGVKTLPQTIYGQRPHPMERSNLYLDSGEAGTIALTHAQARAVVVTLQKVLAPTGD